VLLKASCEEGMTGTAKFVVFLSLFAAMVVPRAARAADPTTADCLTATEAALALRNEHKLQDARSKLLVCSANSCPADVRTECLRRIADVNAAIPTIVFDAKDANGNDLIAVKVTMDGAVLVERLVGTAISIDPGPHTFAFETAGQQRVEKQFVIREGEKDRRERLTFGPAAVVASEPAASVSALPATSAPATILGAPSPPPVVAQRSGAQKKLGLVFGGAAAVGLVTGVTFSLIYDSRATAFNNAGCGTSAVNSGPEGCNSRRSSAETAKDLFIVGYVSAAVLGGVGAYLFLTAPTEIKQAASDERRTLSWSCLPTGAGLSCGGRF
jgi:hypothetical protein